MKPRPGSLIIAFFFFISNFHLVAQSIEQLTISATFEKQTIPEILSQIKTDYRIRFYYQAETIPDKQLQLTVENASLSTVLDTLLKGTTLGYLYYRNYAVVIAPSQTIEELYTANYYKALQQSLVQQADTTLLKQKTIIGQIEQLNPNGKAMISGQVLDSQTDEPIIGATIFIPALNLGTASDIGGHFKMEVPIGEQELLLQYVGYQDATQVLQVYSDGPFEVKLQKAAIELEEVIVNAQAPDANVEQVQIGVTHLDVKAIKKLPAFLGEYDVIKSLLLQPGVSTVGEGATGINVRGGEVDQNLFMLDEGFIFNASHLLGFFSTFQSDLIREATLYKGNIPAQYGGRLASVLDIEMRDGNFEKFQTKGGIGPVSTRLVLEGPVVKNKSSFLTGFRSTYSDWVLKLVNVPEVRRSSAFFYDGNLRYTHRLNDKNTLILSAYASHDEFEFNEEFGFDYTTLMGQLIFKKIFSDQLYSNTSFTLSQYQNIQSDLAGTDASTLESTLSYLKLREHLTYNPGKSIQLDAGFSSILYLQKPGTIRPSGPLSTIEAKTLEKERGLESALFLNAEWKVNPAITISGGLRLALYQYLGAKTAFTYDQSFDTEQIIDTVSYRPGQVIATYTGLEPRFSMRYRLNAQHSIKAGYSRTTQFMNQISNADVPTPTSQWQLSTGHIGPQRSHNFSIGFFKNLKNNNWETSVETYFRYIDQLFDYKDFALLTVNEHIETELLTGKGQAYGMEWSIRKKHGPVHGWLSYTLSRTERLIEGINRGKRYPSNFDKPHDLSLVLNLQPNRRHTFTFNFVYSTGRPTTPPVGRYQADNGLLVPVYAERNQLRIPDYHRLDLAYTMGQGYNKTKKFKTSWTISLYNVYSRRNAFSVYFTQIPSQRPVANRLSVLGNIFPALTFNFETI